ncbi:uncharacterized protein LTR77_003699 [Saxophila tyrrhenica]|uniref:Uncharacterized protein n=1 Tax=Saxophila tyrrhenica TaxID=1690608 RepID=A0AAV9PID5_9PEZI|nr:hypothetical protein LTR77_003699 [Saxophila tyrrhenica]
MEMDKIASGEVWKVRGSDQGVLKNGILRRFKSESMPELEELVEAAGEWTLYPVHILPAKGKWQVQVEAKMPPQGESTGIYIEDALLFSRALVQHTSGDFSDIFAAYQKLRRPQIDAAYTQAVQRWETVKDSDALAFWFMKSLTPWFLWWTAKARENEFAADYSDYQFVL